MFDYSWAQMCFHPYSSKITTTIGEVTVMSPSIFSIGFIYNKLSLQADYGFPHYPTSSLEDLKKMFTQEKRILSIYNNNKYQNDSKFHGIYNRFMAQIDYDQ